MPNMNDTMTVNGQQGEVIGMDREGGKVLVKLVNGRLVWVKV